MRVKFTYIPFLVFVFAICFSNANAQVVVFSENMGSPAATTAIASYTGWQNFGTLTYSGTGDVRNTSPSSVYAGASGAGNVFLTNSGTANFQIAGINTSSYTSLSLSFGILKSTTASSGADLLVEVSSDGVSYTALSFPALPTGTGTVGWYLRTASGAIPSTPNLRIRFTNSGTVTQYRIDDVVLSGVASGSVPNVTAPSISNICLNTLSINWTLPAGYTAATNSIAVFVKAGSPINVGTPTQNISSYSYFNTFGASSTYEHDAAAYAVYVGDASTVAVNGLTPGTAYHVLIFNVTDPSTYSSGVTVSATTLAAPAPVTAAAGTAGSAQATVSWTNPAFCYDQVLVIGRAGSAPTSTPTGNGSLYTANSVFGTGGSGGNLDAGDFAVYKGTGSSVNITNLTNGVTYHFTIYTRKDNVWSSGVTVSATPVAPPDVTAINATNVCPNSSTLNWTNPSPTGTIMVFAKAGSAVNIGTPTLVPSAYATHSTNVNNGPVYENDPDARLVYRGTLQTVNLTGMTAGTTYHFLVFNVNPNTSNNYSNGATFNVTTPATPANVTAATATAGINNVQLSWTNPGTCFTQVLVIGRAGSPPTSVPTGDGTLYNGHNTIFGSGTSGANLDAGDYAVYRGTLGSTTVTNLVVGTTYYFTIFTRSGTAWSTGVTVSATPVPPANVTGFTYTASCVTTGTLNWTLPAGYAAATYTTLVFAKEGSAINVGTPTANSNTYGANASYSNFATASIVYENDAQAKLVYRGDGTSVNLTNLTTGETYHFLALVVFDPNTYSTGATTTGTAAFTPVNVTGAATAIGNGQITISWTNPTCFHEVLVLAREAAAPFSVPSGNGTQYTASPVFADPNTDNGQNLTLGDYAVYKGTGAAVTVSGLTNGTAYHFRIFTRIGSTWSNGVTVFNTPNTPAGDYRSITNGTWTSHTTWERSTSPGVWVPAVSGEFPNLPTASVTIQNGHTVVLNGTGPYDVRNLTVENNAKLWANTTNANKYLSIHGTAVVNNGIIGNNNPLLADDISFNFENGAAGAGQACVVSGSGVFSASRIRKFDNAQVTTDVTFNIDIYLTWNGTALYNATSSNTRFNITQSATRLLHLVSGNLSIDGTNGAQTGNNGGTFTFNGTVIVAGTTYMTTNNTTVNFGCNMIVGTNGLLRTGTITAPASSTAAAGFNLTLQSGATLEINAPGAFVAYSTTNNTFNVVNGVVEYSATLDTQLVRPLTYGTLRINNPNGVSLGTNVSTQLLQLNNGKVNTYASELFVTTATAAAISNHSATRYVNGNLRRAIGGSATFDFPVGTALLYELIQLKNNALTGTSNVLAFFTPAINGPVPNLTVNGVLINTLLNAGYWTLTPNQQPTGGSYDVILHERGHTNAAVISQQQYTVLKRPNSSSAWVHEGTTVGNSQQAGGGVVIVPLYGLASFSDFAIGFGNAVLPVTLTHFDAALDESRHAVLTWRTESELNNHFFEVQRSVDGSHYTVLGIVTGNGTSTVAHDYRFVDFDPLHGYNYYRLRQVDFDGAYAYSPVRVVALGKGVQDHVVVTQAGNALVVTGVLMGTRVTVYDVPGRAVAEAIGDEALRLDMSGMSSGIYFVHVQSSDGRVRTLKCSYSRL